jgi:hypothetical protein
VNGKESYERNRERKHGASRTDIKDHVGGIEGHCAAVLHDEAPFSLLGVRISGRRSWEKN